MRWKHRLLLIAAGSLAALFLIEFVVRLAAHSPLLFLGGPESDRYVTVDPMVGRVPKAGLTVRIPKGPNGYTCSTEDYGTRRNGEFRPRAQRPLTLAVGDSFAFGDEVNDEESWPAILEQLSGRRVINAGVPGFGLDQALLRAAQLAEIYSPNIIVVSFIPHDVLRCEMSYWSGHPKPYFDLDAGELRLHPAPLPPPSPIGPLKRLLSVSVAMDLVFPRFLHWEGPEAQVIHHHGREVACLLMQRLAVLGRTHKARIVVLAQPQAPDPLAEHLDIKNFLLACAREQDLVALDLFPVIERLPPEQRARLFHGHMTAEGNRLVATELARLLERESPPQDHPS